MKKTKKIFITIGATSTLLGITIIPTTLAVLSKNQTSNLGKDFKNPEIEDPKPGLKPGSSSETFEKPEQETKPIQPENEPEKVEKPSLPIVPDKNKIYQSDSGIKFSGGGEVVGYYEGSLDPEIFPHSVNITNELTDKDNPSIKVKITSIAKNAFRGKKIKWLYIGSAITKIGDYAFQGSEINELKLAGWPGTIEESQLTHIGKYAFENHYLEKISIPSNVKEIGEGAFQTLGREIQNQTIDFSESKSLIEIKSLAFFGNYFTEIFLPKSLQKIGHYAFKTRVNSLLKKTIIVRSFTNSLLEYNEYTTFIGYSNVLFDTYNDNELKTNIFETKTGFIYNKLGEVVGFRFEQARESIRIPEKLTDKLDKKNEKETVATVIKEGLFKGDKKIVFLILPSTIKTIEKEAFMDTVNLKYLWITDHVFSRQSDLEDIGENAFKNANLSVVNLSATQIKHLKSGIFANNPIKSLYLSKYIFTIAEGGTPPFQVDQVSHNIETKVWMVFYMFNRYPNLDELSVKLFSSHKPPFIVDFQQY